MIRINHLAIQNFMNIQKADFDFGNINYLYGEPASGKSAIFEAISVCFSDEKRSSTYGEYVKQGCDFAKIEIKFSIYGKDTEMKVTLNRVGGTPYECELVYEGETYKNTKATEKLNEFNLNYYSKIMFQMQNAKDIVEQTSASRLEYIKNLFNFDYSEQKDILTQRMKELKEKSLQLLTQKSSNITLKEELSKLEEEQTLPYSENDITHFNSVIHDNIEEISKANKLMEEENAHLKRLHQYEMEIKNVENILTNLRTKKSNIETYKNQLLTAKETIDKIKKQNETLKNDKQSLETSAILFKENIDALITKIVECREEKNILIGKASSLKERQDSCKDGICPVCGQKTDEVMGHFEEEIKSLETRIDDLDILENEQLQHENAEKSGLEKVRAQQATIEDVISKNLFNIMSAEKTVKDLQTLIDEGKDIDNLIAEAEEKLKEHKKNYSFESAVAIQKMDIEGILAENNELNSKIKSYELCVNKNKDIRNRNAAKIEKVTNIDESLKQIESSIIELTNMDAVYSEAWEILNKLLPQYRTQIFCETIKNDLNRFIHLIFPKYDVLVKTSKKGCDLLYTKDNTVKDEKKNKWLDTRMSSGFERAVLTTAFKIILARYYDINLFVGDEIDKASSDKDSIKLISELLNLNQFSQVFLISHKKALGNYLEENYEDLNIYEAKDGRFTKKN